MAYPTPVELIAWFDANPTRYKNTPDPGPNDGYNSTEQLSTELATQYPVAAGPAPQVYEFVPTVPGTKALLDDDSKGRLDDNFWSLWTELILGMGQEVSAQETERRDTGVEFIDNAVARANLSAEEQTAINNYLTNQVDDPAWPANVPGPSDSRAQWDVGGINHDYINQSLGR